MKPLTSSLPSTPRSFFRHALLASCLQALLAAPGLHAATVVWDGSGDATWTNPDSNSWSGSTYNNGDAAQFLGSGSGTVTLSGTIAPGSVLVDSANDYLFSGVLSGAGSLTKNGSSTLTLASTNTYTGGTTVNAGTLRLSAGPSGGSLVINSGANVTATNHGMYGFSTITINGGTLNTGGYLQRGSNNALTMTNGTITGGGDWAASSYTLYGNNTINTLIGDRSATFNVVSGTTTVSGEIKYHWGGNVTKTGAGTLNLTGANTYGWSSVGGQTFLNAGTLGISNSRALGSGYGAFTINGGTIDNLSAGAITLINNNAQNWNADFTFAGTRDLNMGTGAVTMNASRNITVNAGNFTVGGVISGAGFGLTKAGNGAMILGGNNTYSGATTINAGTLQINHANALGSTGNITFGGGALRYNTGITQDLSSRIKNSGSAIVIDTNSNNVTFASAVDSTNSGGLTKNGTGTLTLSATNTYNGSTTINAGTLQIDGNIANSGLAINSGATISPGTSVAADSFGTSSITINGGGYNWTLNTANGSAGTGWDQITSTGALTSSGLLTVYAYGTPGDWDGTASYSWDIFNANSTSGFSAGNFTMNLDNFGIAAGNRTGTWAFSNPSGGIIRLSYTPLTDPVWTGGTGSFSTGFSPPPSNGDDLFFYGTGGGTATNDTLTSAGSITFMIGAGAYTLSGNAITVTGAVTNNSSSTQTLNTNVAPSSIVINDGAVEIGASGRLGGGSTSATISNSGTLIYSGTSAQTLSGSISGTGALTKNAASTLTLTGNNTYSGATTINAGTLQITGSGQLGGGSYAGNISMTGNFFYLSSADQSFSGVISGAGTFYKYSSSASTLTLSGNNTMSGTFQMGFYAINETAGTVKLEHNKALGTKSIIWENDGTINIATNGLTISNSNNIYARNSATDGKRRYLLDLAGSNTGTFSGNFDIRMSGLIFDVGTDDTLTASGSFSNGGGGGGFEKTGAGTLVLTGATNTLNGNIVISAGTLQIGNGGTTGTLNSLAVTNNGALVFNRSNALTVANAISGSGNVIKNASNTLTLTGNNTYSGDTTINAGTLEIGAAGRLGAGSYAGDISNDGTLVYSGTNAQTLSGVISGSGALTKNAASTLTLTGSNTYSGGTTLNTGTLVIGNAAAAGSGTITQTDGTSLLTFDTTGTIANNMSIYNVASNQSVTLTGSITAQNTTYDVASGTTLSINGSIGGSGGVTKDGDGTLELNAANTFTGDTEINFGTLEANATGSLANTGNIRVNGGSLLVGANNAINDSAAMDLAGGTLEFGGSITETIGALTLSANSTIDMGGGNVFLEFSNLVTQLTSTTRLNIYNYTLYSDHLSFGSNTNLSDSLPYISFYSGFGTGFIGNSFIEGINPYEIRPVPEPETWATGILLVLGSSVWMWRKRRIRI